MTKKRKRQIYNDKLPEHTIAGVPEKTVKEDIFKQWNITFDLSFKGCFCSVKEQDFNNFLKDEKDFAVQHKKLVDILNKLSEHTMNELISNGNYAHCHTASDEKAYRIIKNICEKIGLSNMYFEQNIGSEKIYQLGINDSVRIFGTVNGNVFRLLFIDYFHEFFPDQRRNERNGKNYKFCPMSV